MRKSIFRNERGAGAAAHRSRVTIDLCHYYTPPTEIFPVGRAQHVTVGASSREVELRRT